MIDQGLPATDLDEPLKHWRQGDFALVWKRHDKSGSEPGKVYRSLAQIRFSAEPNWIAENRKIKVVAIMKETAGCKATRAVISEELDNILGNIEWPNGYAWGKPKLMLGTAKDLIAEDIILSQRGDFDFLCY